MYPVVSFYFSVFFVKGIFGVHATGSHPWHALLCRGLKPGSQISMPLKRILMKLRIFTKFPMIKRVTRLVFCLNECYNDFCFYYNYKDECLTGKKNITHKFTRNYIRDPHSVISISPRVRILMMSLSVFLTVVSAVSLSKSRTSGCDHLSSTTSFRKYPKFPSQIGFHGWQS